MFDLQQVMFGDTTPVILLEIVFRTVVMYLYLLLLLRLLGARGLAQLSAFEFAIIIALGSAVGDAMFYLDIPLIEGMLVITVVVVIQRIIVWVTNRSRHVEDILEGKAYALVENGVVNLENMYRTALSHDELFMELREKGAEQLGQVKYAFLEVNGQMSVFLLPRDTKKAGLPIVPPWEISHPQYYLADQSVPHEAHYACMNCGNTKPLAQGAKVGNCSVCQKQKWMQASEEKVSA